MEVIDSNNPSPHEGAWGPCELSSDTGSETRGILLATGIPPY